MEIQKAGDNSQQYQIQQLTIHQGIDEKRAREIYDEKYCIAKKDFTEEALRVANERVKELENRLIRKLEVIKDGFKAFADPSFQLLLVDAQKSAAASERAIDYDLLSELLVHRIEKGNDRHVRTGIHRAVEIIEDISDEALLGLTVVYSVNSFIPIASDIKRALIILDNLFGKIMYTVLPDDEEWIEELDILDAIRISQFSSFKTIKDLYSDRLSGLIDVGICKDSEEYHKVEAILQEQNLPFSLIMVDNPLNPNYVRVNVRDINEVNSLYFVQSINGVNYNIHPSSEQKNAIKSIFKLYSSDSKIREEINGVFISEWEKHPNLLKLKDWWEKLSCGFSITTVGKVLAHAYVQRCDNTVPPLNPKSNKNQSMENI